ncbi:MAG TPA: hypothetical protein DDX92_12075 [Flavobacteriales bacterium]|jgi:hypothetical protein|nr:hypothetical protein [Flavobacteriales bacterium]
MRFTWEHATWTVVVLIVVTGIGTFILSLGERTELVTDDYYARELAFQEQIDKIENAQSINAKIGWSQNSGGYQFSMTGDFDHTQVKGRIVFFRPSSRELDTQYPLNLDSNGVQNVPLELLKPGRYQIQASWNDGIKDFYLEKNIFVQ